MKNCIAFRDTAQNLALGCFGQLPSNSFRIWILGKKII